MLPLLLSLALGADPEPPKVDPPRIVVGFPLPEGAARRFGPAEFVYAGFAPQLRSVAYSPDGTRLALNTGTGFYLWDAATGKRLLWVPSEGDTLSTFVGFGTGTEVVVACAKKWDDLRWTAFRVDAATGKVVATFRSPKERRAFRACAPDGKVVYARTWDGTNRSTVATELDTGKELWRTTGNAHDDWMQLSPDGSRLIVWSASAIWACKVLDTATGNEVGRFGHTDRDASPTWTNGGIAVAPRAEWVAAAHAWNRGFTLWKAGSEKAAHWQKGGWHDHVFLPAGGTDVVALRWRHAHVIETYDLATFKLKGGVKSEVEGDPAALSPDGKTLALCNCRNVWGTVQLVDAATGKRRAPSPDTFSAGHVWFDGGALVTADEYLKRARKWDARTGAATDLPAGTTPPAAARAPAGFNPEKGTTNVVFAPDGTRALAYRHDPDEVDGVPGDHWFALLSGDGAIVTKFEWPEGGAKYAFTPDGGAFAIARGDGTITFYDTKTAKPFGTRRGASLPSAVAFAPDGKRFVTAGGEAPLTLWDVPPRK